LPALARLRNRGWSHIVLSNHVPELPQLVEALGLSDFIMAVYCSACTGVEKPHRKAFETVFARYPEAHNGWMIGDSWRADVQGALAVGMRAILVRS
jgi:putative hydrolase of the HAD superfamily